MTQPPRRPLPLDRSLSQLMPWSQSTRRFNTNQAKRFVEFITHWMTQHAGFPATAEVSQRDGRTFVIVVTVDPPGDHERDTDPPGIAEDPPG